MADKSNNIDPSSKGPSNQIGDPSASEEAGNSGAQRRSKRERAVIDYAKIEEGVVIPLTSDYYFMEDDNNNDSAISTTKFWASLMKSCKFVPYYLRSFHGDMLTLDWIRNDGLLEPLMVPSISSNFGIIIPHPSSFSVREVAKIIGYDEVVNIIDVSKQEEIPGGWTLEKWADYYEAAPSKRKQLYQGGPLNVISLEFSNTKLKPLVRAPSVVRQLDWIHNAWPEELKAKNIYPAAQYYCLMSVAGCYTDFHIGTCIHVPLFHKHTLASRLICVLKLKKKGIRHFKTKSTCVHFFQNKQYIYIYILVV
jgi:hypothetical protein